MANMYPDLPGIYCITNKLNGHRYVGSATNLRKRKNRHFSELKLGGHYNTHLQHAANFYGLENFEFHPLIICDKDLLVYYEQTFIDGLKPEYNARLDATINLGLHHTEETKRRLSETQKGRKLSDTWIKNRNFSRAINNTANKKFPICNGKFRVVFRHKHIGVYDTEEEARLVYMNCITAYYGIGG